MMSTRQWCVGMIFYTLYLFLGAAFYYRSESGLERERRYVSRRERIEIFTLLHEHYGTALPGDAHKFAERLTEYCGLPVTNTTLEDDVADGPYKWNAFNSFLFAITVTTTVGYGNLAPTSDAGRMSMIPYALVGIPFTGILLASLGEFFSVVILRIKARYKRQQRIETRLQLFGDVAAYICAGVVAFVLLPACAFVYMEQWSWSLAVYYAFVTISTVGFGDFVAAQQPELGHGDVAFTAYRVALVLWIIFGLGYYFMILAYLTRGMRSKRVLRLEHRLAKNLRDTHARVWHSVTRDVGYLRRALNVAYLQRVTPVYKETGGAGGGRLARGGRSSSAPDVRDLLAMTSPRLAHARSESELARVDRDATFRQSQQLTQRDLLEHVVDALAGARSGLSEADILESEGEPWRPDDVRVTMEPQLKTWSSPEPRKLAATQRHGRRNTWFHVSSGESVTSTRSQGLLERWQRQRHKARSLGSLLASNTGADADADDAEVGSLLEETSVGEFLRALASVHGRHPAAAPAAAPALAHLFDAAPASTSRRRFSVRPTPTPTPTSVQRRDGTLGRRYSALPTLPTPATSGCAPRRSSLRGAAGNRFPREQPLRPRFRLGPDSHDVARSELVHPRGRHASS